MESKPQGERKGAIDHLPFEIIEIGAIKLDENRNPIGEFQQLVSPSVYSQIHYKISEVTHLDMKTLQREGVPFSEAISSFLAWCGKDFWFVTWGSMDLTERSAEHGLFWGGDSFSYAAFVLRFAEAVQFGISRRR